MIKSYKLLFTLFIGVLLINVCNMQVFAENKSYIQSNQVIKQNGINNAKAAYVLDPTNNQTIYSYNANAKLPIASLSKLMSLYIVNQAINEHKIKWNDKITITPILSKMSKSSEYGTYIMKPYSTYTVQQLYKMTLISSSNSAIITLANKIYGNETKFVKQMNDLASQWNIQANFMSASGLDHSDLAKYSLNTEYADKENLVSAKAISIVGAKLLKIFPNITKWSTSLNTKINNQMVDNSDRLLKYPFYNKNNFVDGLKTGYTENAGLCLLTTYKHNGHRLIATVLGSTASFSTMNNIINYFNNIIVDKHVNYSIKKFHDYNYPKYLWLNKNDNKNIIYTKEHNNKLIINNPLNDNNIILNRITKSSHKQRKQKDNKGKDNKQFAPIWCVTFLLLISILSGYAIITFKDKYNKK